MKKYLFACLSFLLISFTLTARPNLKAIEISVSGNHIKSSDEAALSGIGDELAANLSKYTNLKIVNSTNKSELIEASKRNEEAIEAGKFRGSSHIIFLEVGKLRSNYTVTLRLTDLQTRDDIAVITSNRTVKDINDLYIGNGSIIDEMTIEFCDKIGTPLSEMDKKIIMKGESGLSLSEKEELYKNDINQYQKKVNELNKELKSLKHNTEGDIQRRIIEAQIEDNMAKLRLAEARQKRLDEENKNKDQAAEKYSKIKDAEQSKFNKASSEINNKLEELRQLKKDDMSLIKTVRVIIENKKAQYLATLAYLEETRNVRQKAIDKKREDVIKEIDSKKWNKVDLTNKDENGNILSKKVPTKQAIQNRENQKLYALQKIEDEDVRDMNNQLQKIQQKANDIKVEIQSDYDNMKPQTLTTLGNELIVTYGEYDAINYGWPLYVTVQIDDNLILETTSFLPYEKATGKKVVKELDPSHEEIYNDFSDTVDYYDALFLSGTQKFTFSLDYIIKPLGFNEPSKYVISFTNFRYYETKDVKVKDNKISSKANGSLKLEKDKTYKQFYPVYDLRTEEERKEYEEIKAYKEEQERKAIEKERIRKEEAEKERIRREKEAEEQRIYNEKLEQERKVRAEQEAKERKEREAQEAIERQEREEQAAIEREIRKEEMKENAAAFWDDTKETFANSFEYHKNTKGSNIFTVSFNTIFGGGLNAGGASFNYDYMISDSLGFGVELRLYGTDSSTYFGFDSENPGMYISNIIDFKYKYDLQDFMYKYLDFLADTYHLCFYADGGIGYGVGIPTYSSTIYIDPNDPYYNNSNNSYDPNNPYVDERKTTGNFLFSGEVGLETTIVDIVVLKSGLGFDWGLGKQDYTGRHGYFGLTYNLGVGARF